MLEVIKNALWGPATVLFLSLLGVVILIKTKFYTIIRLPSILRDTLLSVKNNRHSFSLMCTSLGGTIGVGNAIGVAGAITEGGAGAVFWMGVAGIIGIAVKYTEIYFSILYRSPMGYIEKISSKSVAHLYAFLCIGVSFGMGNMSQVRSAVTSAQGVFPTTVFVLLLTFTFLFVARGGLEKIRKVSEVTVPLLSGLYILALVVILIKQKDSISNVGKTIFSESGIFTGIKWAVIKKGLSGGFSKAIFSSEAGLGSAGFSHKESSEFPSQQAKWGVVEVAVDSVICIMTAFALLTFSNELSGVSEMMMTKKMFCLCFGGYGKVFYAVSMAFFAFSSIICWYYNGSCSVKYLSGNKKHEVLYYVCFALIIATSGFIGDSTVIEFSDIANALMMLVNISAVWTLVLKNSLTF